MDPVNHKELKGKFKDRKDKDIDNDGDTDSSDEYLHKRRKAVSKAIGKIKEAAKKCRAEEVDLDEAKTDIYHKHMLKALGKSRLPKNHAYRSAIANNGDFVVHDGGGRVVGRIPKGEHNLKEAKGLWDNIHAKRKRIEAGSGEKMRKPGSKGAPTDADFRNASESVEQIDEIQINWSHKIQKYHTIKHPDGSHWGVFDHSTYGTKGHEIRKIRDAEGNALRAKDSRKQSGSGYKAGMGSPSDAAKEWAKKHGGTITNHKIKD